MPQPALDPVTQRAAIIRQLAPGATRPPLGSLPPLEDAPAAPAAPAAQSGPSKWAKILYGAGAGADIGSTINTFAHGGHEANPLVNFAGDKMAIPIGIAEEAGTYMLAKKLLGDKHPKILNMLLAGSGIAHGAAAAHNMMLPGHGAGAGPTSSAAPSLAASHGNLVQAPDGSWIDPSVITLPPR